MVVVNKIYDVYPDGTKLYGFGGESTDSKPTAWDGKDIGVGSLFLELDTGDFYYFDGTTWSKVGG